MNTQSQSEYFDHQHLTVIEPIQGWRMLDWRELWAYRELLWVLTSRDIKVRYKQTVLGAAWAVLRPFTTMVIFSVDILSKVLDKQFVKFQCGSSWECVG